MLIPVVDYIMDRYMQRDLNIGNMAIAKSCILVTDTPTNIFFL